VKRPLVAIFALTALLVGLLVWRLRGLDAAAEAPSGGTATVEGVETVVGARASGRVLEVLVREGDRVTAGQPLVRIDCRDAEAMLALADAHAHAVEAQVEVHAAQLGSAADSAAVARAQAAAVRAQAKVLAVDQAQTARDRARAEKLASGGAIPEAELERTVARLEGVQRQLAVVGANSTAAELASKASSTGVKVVEANLEVARAQLAASRIEIDRARLAVAECTIVAPSDGLVTARLVEPGVVVVPGARVIVTVSTDPARLTFYLPNRELSRAAIGAPATVRVDAYPERSFAGVVRRIADEAEFTPRNVQTREDRDRLVYAVEVEVPNGDGALRPGMPAEVSLDGTGR
jgi:HlyD family secretion protein